ncbi:hypothetical protein BT96DRAFT_931112 [Gymnopus androsaceus JB14]|uniref:Uncharacterized protein n=1 Tax=Gymnopus androsaceus JB14 TaxID=1447944 RepID=A0A6A4IIL1_9AGAR|nr:hypothetical protein BT96DRAFT_931112 [Gymnopus androsaceus JB14]
MSSYIQLGGFNLSTTVSYPWYKQLQSQKLWFDQKAAAQKAFDALIEEQDEIVLTLGILPSGHSVLLLTRSQVRRICDYHRRFRLPVSTELLPSEKFESLSPIEFVDVDALAAKLSSLTPKDAKRGDTSQNNKAFNLDPDGAQGIIRGLFENLRVLRQVAMGRISPPSFDYSSSTRRPPIHTPYAQFCLGQTINTTLVPRISVASLSYTLWNGKDVLEFGWAKARDGMRDLRAQEPAGLEGKKGPEVGMEIFERLVRLGLQFSLSSQQQHLILLVHNEPKLRKILLDLDVDVLSGKFDDDLDGGGDVKMNEGGRRWNWIHEGDVGLKELLRDDAGYRDHDYRDRGRRYDDHNSRTSTSYSSTPSSHHGYNDYNHRSSKTHRRSRSRSPPHRHSANESYGSYSEYYGTVKREPKEEQRDEFDALRVKHEDGDDHFRVKSEGYNSEIGYDAIRSGSGRGEYRVKKEKKEEEKLGVRLKAEASGREPELSDAPLQIHVVDLQVIFAKATGIYLGQKDSVQEIARDLQKGGGGVKLPGMLDGEYGAGWDAELMLSIFQRFTDGRTIDEQGAAGLERSKTQMEEDEETARRLKEEQEMERAKEKAKSSRRVRVDEDR